FEDEKDQEEIYVHAQKDQNIVVNHDETTRVGRDRKENVEHDETIGIGHDRIESVGNDEQVTIGKDRRHQIGQDDALRIERNRTISVGKDRIETVGNHRKDQTTANHLIDVGGHVEQTVQGHHKLSAGQRIERQTQRYQLQAGERAVFRGPGGAITLDDSGITIEGITIKLKGPVQQGGAGARNVFAVDGHPNAGDGSDVGTLHLDHRYHDDEGLKGATYTLTLPDGSQRTGQLDANGQATVPGVSGGSAWVQYSPAGFDYARRDQQPMPQHNPDPSGTFEARIDRYTALQAKDDEDHA
ncbi:bacteriophage T4 gp5 trimerisation domain-containing protein, partial [Dyella japonica]